MDLNTRLEQASADHSAGLNCAQSVFKQFCVAGGVETATALRLTSGFGGGMKVGTVCGALSGGIMALGLYLGSDDPARKAEMEAPVRELISRFEAKMEHMECRAIIGYDVSDPAQKAIAKELGIFEVKCDKAIRTAVEIVYEMLERSGFLG